MASHPLPPGPPRKPVLGNVLEIPTERMWERIIEWKEVYGDVIYAEALGQPMVFLNNADVANELLEKRSLIYSDRASYPMMNELCGLGWHFAFMHYGDTWRQARKIFHQEFNYNACQSFRPLQLKNIHVLVLDIQRQPDLWYSHLKRLAAAVIMESTYGIKIGGEDDPYVRAADKALEYVGMAGAPGAWLVDTFPILKNMPEWLPGAGFKRNAKIWNKAIMAFVTEPFAWTKRAFEEGTAPPSFTASWLERLANNPDLKNRQDMELAIRDVGGSAYGAGFTTTWSTVALYILGMLHRPDAQRKAQEEIDRVVGRERMPEYSDMKDLTYVYTIYQEALRWRPVSPMGVPHRTTKDDVYNGMFIPKGTHVVCNQWQMLHDESVYGPEPDQFNPDRFLDPNIPYPLPAFGFGRRICPGRYMADSTIVMAIASILHLFTVDPKGNPTRKEVEEMLDRVEFTPGFLRHPMPFDCDLVIRDSAAEKLLEGLKTVVSQ